MSVKVKICGVTSVADALHAAAAGADAIGLNFHPPSPRCVSVEAAAEIAAALPRGVCRVGVFVDQPRDRVAAIAARVGLDGVQFHGHESPDDCRDWQLTTIKAVRVRDARTLRDAARDYAVAWLLADAYVAGVPGGTGTRVPLEWLTDVARARLILAGGLTAETVADAVRVVRPAAVDVASGVERAPGVKDPEKVERFITNARMA
ncbi:MAG: phosphoribosylanthranilate isomerase [Deltaproteobacteria bacterium]|nr:phosphoribosylanthranilate isomerase [Deltaproteobacteria bacterium]